MPRFVLFGPGHLAALAVIAGVAVLLARLVAKRRASAFAAFVRLALATGLAGLVAFELITAAREGWLTLEVVLPLQLCDAAMLLAVLALITLKRAFAELLYFWAAAGMLPTVLTPDLPVGFPRWEFLIFFGLHGLCIVSAVVLVFGFGLVPRRGAPWRAFLATNVYAAFVALVNWLLRANYLYLCAKPANPTLLDYFGPWPLYLVVGDAFGLALFWVFDLPLRPLRRRAEGRAQGPPQPQASRAYP
jgi:hypothetical integral membrane protein (TIGR02206 family)